MSVTSEVRLLLRREDASVPLTRDKIIGHDSERLAFRFTMLNEGKLVPCQISDAAMDELGGVIGTENSARQAQFLLLRDDIEKIASDLFAQGPAVDGYVVRIFSKHVRQWQSAAAARETEAASPPSLEPDAAHRESDAFLSSTKRAESR